MNTKFKRGLVMAGTVSALVGTNAFSVTTTKLSSPSYGQVVDYSQTQNYESTTPRQSTTQARTYPVPAQQVQQVQNVLNQVIADDAAEIPTAEISSASNQANQPQKVSPGSALDTAARAEAAAAMNPVDQKTHIATLKNAGNDLQTTSATACLASVTSVNSPSCALSHGPTSTKSIPLLAPPIKAGSCETQRVNIPGSHNYASEYMEKIVGVPAKNPTTLFGISADLSGDSLKAGNSAMYISKSIDGGKSWTQISKIDSSKFDSVQDGLYNGLSVSDDGSNMVFTTKKGAFPLTKSGDSYVMGDKLVPATFSQAAATDVKISPDGTKMAVAYGFFDQQGTVVNYTLDKTTKKWVKGKDSVLPIPTGSTVLSLQYDPNGKLYAGTGNFLYSADPSGDGWNKVHMYLPGTKKDKNGKVSQVMKEVTDVSVYKTTFKESKDKSGNSVYTPSLAATCWGTMNVPSHSMARSRNFDVEVSPDPQHPENVVRTTDKGAEFSTNGGKIWKKIPGLPDCESTSSPGQLITKSSAACQDVLDVRNHKIPPHAKMDPQMYASEFRTAHINSDGTVLISGTSGTYLTNPFSASCK